MDRESPSRQRNREIRDAESRLRRLADLMLVGVLLFRRDGSLDYVNRAAREILDMPDPEDPGWRELGSLMSGALRSAWEEGREDGRMELDWTTEESSRRLRFQINFVDEEDCRGFVVLVRDREVLSALDADLGVAAQLRNLSRLYLGLAHDLRSPLHTVGLHLELVTSAVERGEGDSEEVVEWLRVAREQVDRLSSGVDILLAQAVLPAARPEPFDLGDLVVSLEPVLESQARQEKIRLSIDHSSEPLPVVAHRDRIRQALLNLVVNGLEAMEDGGSLRLAAERQDDEWAVVRVEDTGPGIAEEELDRIFDLHFSHKAEGTGIGLYVARSSFEAGGGSLEVRSTGPDGTTFEGRLPLARGEEAGGERG